MFENYLRSEICAVHVTFQKRMTFSFSKEIKIRVKGLDL